MKFYKKLLNLDGLISTAIVFLALLVFPLIFRINFLLPFYNSLSDFQITDVNYQQMRVPEEVLADTNIVMINISALNNGDLADLISSVNENSPKVIGIERLLKTSDNDTADFKLAGALSQVKNLVLANKFIYNKNTKRYDSLINADKLFTQFGTQGFSNLLLDGRDNVETVREFYTNLKYKDTTIYPFSVQVVRLFNPHMAAHLFERHNDKEIINFRGKFDKFYFVSEPEDILNKEIDKNLFYGKIILLSDSDPLQEVFVFSDKYYTPLNDNASGRALPDMYGIEIQTNIISEILQNNYFNTISSNLAILIAFVFCYLNMLMYLFFEDKVPEWYEILSLVVFIIDSIFLILVNYQVYHNYQIDLKLNFALFALIFSTPIFEAYTKSIKDLSIEFYHKFFKR